MGAGCWSDNKVHQIRNSSQHTTNFERLDTPASIADLIDIKSDVFQDYEFWSEEVSSNDQVIERKVKHKASNKIRYMKIYKKEALGWFHRGLKDISLNSNNVMKKMLLNEYQILGLLDHPNIIKWYDFYDEPKYCFVVYDYIAEIDLKHYMTNLDLYNESNAYYLLIQVARALDHMHTTHKICHRDIRLDIVKITNFESKFFPKIVLSCFQNAKRFKGTDNKVFSDYYNKSLEYCSPEILKGKAYSEKADIWSFGVLVHTFLWGYPPFRAKTADELKEKIMKAKFKYEQRDWKNKSEDVKDLINKCLSKTSKNRPTAHEILNHKWFKHMAKTESTKSAIRKVLVKDMTESLKHFQMMNYLQKSFLKFIFEQISNDELSIKLKEEFDVADTENTGMLETSKLKEIYLKWSKSILAEPETTIKDKTNFESIVEEDKENK